MVNCWWILLAVVDGWMRDEDVMAFGVIGEG